MDRPPLSPDDLVCIAGIAERANVSVIEVHAWVLHAGNGFPSPLVTLEIGPVFFWPEVEDWLAAPGLAS